MSKKHLSFYISLLIFSGYAFGENFKEAESISLKEEFNIKHFWYEGMTWDKFLKVKRSLQHPELCTYSDKIKTQEMALEAGLQVPKTYIASYEEVPVVELISHLTEPYVAKPTHFAASQGLMIVKNGIDMLTKRPISPEQVERMLYKYLKKNCRETWVLSHVRPGIMIQEYIPERMEIKIQTVFGKVIAAIWHAGEINHEAAPTLGHFDRDGNVLTGDCKTPEWWANAVAAAELLAQGTDALRVDFLVRSNGELLLNEVALHPTNQWLPETLEAFSVALNDGYRKLAK